MARVCRWYGGKKAAVSLRFDDSHSSHIELAVPALNERGLVGTFLVCPGVAGYRNYHATWEGAVVAAGHELADHTMSHQGASSDAEAEWEIGEAARIVRQAQPDLPLLVFQRGGGTAWLQRKPIEYLTARYHLYDLDQEAGRPDSRVMSCSEQYPWFSTAAFSEALDQCIAEGRWFQPHFHCIGEGWLPISASLFDEVLEVVADRREQVWNASIGCILQYGCERDHSTVFAHAVGDDLVALFYACELDGHPYRQPLTIEVDLPSSCESAAVIGPDGTVASHVTVDPDGRRVVRFDVRPRDGAYQVEARGLGAAYRQPSGDLQAPGPHPYLFFSREDVPALLAKDQDQIGHVMWQAILEEAETLAGAAPGPADKRGTGAVRERVNRLRPLAFAYALTGEERYGRAAIHYVEAVIADESWHSTESEMLVTAGAICTLGLAYDWLYDIMDDSLKSRLRETIVEYGFKPVTAATTEGVWWTDWTRGNWGLVIYGQIGVAALSMLSDEPQAADMLRICQGKAWHYVQAIGSDGGWGESGSYALYAWSNGLMFLDALNRVAHLNLIAHPNLRAFPTWLTNLLEPDGENFVPFSNCGPWTGDMPSILYRLAREHQDGCAQAVASRKTMAQRRADIFGLIWYDPSVSDETIAGWPLGMLFPSIDWAFLRSRWNDPQTVLFALKGGQKDWDHYHHDTNSFVLYAHGAPLLVDLLYPHRLWGCQTEAHNTVMVNGKDQRGEVRVAGMRGSPEDRGVVAGFINTPWYAHLVGDASMAYDPQEVSSFVREVMYLRHQQEGDPPDYFVMFDELAMPESALPSWLAHTYAHPEVEGNVVTVTQDGGAIDINVVAPAPAIFDVRSKTLEEVGSPRPFPQAEAVTWVAVHPESQTKRGIFLSVLTPRPADSPSTTQVTGIGKAGTVGAAIANPGVRDIALFALDSPEIDCEGVEAAARSCLIRERDGRVAAAALYAGKRLSWRGSLLFETDGCGQAAIAFGDDAVWAHLDLYDSHSVRLRVGGSPARVLVNGAERNFLYDPEQACIEVKGPGIREIKALFRET